MNPLHNTIFEWMRSGNCSRNISRSIPNASEGWWKVTFSVCHFTHRGYPISIPQYFHWSHVLFRGTTSLFHNTFHCCHVLSGVPITIYCPVTGPRFLSGATPVPVGGTIGWGTPWPEQDWCTPDQDRTRVPPPPPPPQQVMLDRLCPGWYVSCSFLLEDCPGIHFFVNIQLLWTLKIKQRKVSLE